MQRDPRLHGLSSDHHHALALARRLLTPPAGAAIDVTDLRRRFDAELAPHFAIEEDLLLPALRAAGRPELADRTLAEHDALRAHLASAEAGDAKGARRFAALLADHVRFEERELFPACEASLDDATLDRVACACRPAGAEALRKPKPT